MGTFDYSVPTHGSEAIIYHLAKEVGDPKVNADVHGAGLMSTKLETAISAIDDWARRGAEVSRRWSGTDY
jgi:hypothetical protein